MATHSHQHRHHGNRAAALRALALTTALLGLLTFNQALPAVQRGDAGAATAATGGATVGIIDPNDLNGVIDPND